MSGKAPTTAETATTFLRGAGLGDGEIVNFAGSDDSKLKYTHARRVLRLSEKFTAADFKVLAEVLYKTETVLSDRMVTQLLKLVESGGMNDFFSSHNVAAESYSGFKFSEEFEGGLGMSITQRNVRKSRSSKELEALKTTEGVVSWRQAELDTLVALEDQFGPGWTSPRFQTPGAKKAEMLGSTAPDAYHPRLNVAVEVKQLNLLEGGLDPENPGGLGTPSKGSKEALERAMRQAVGREWAIPKVNGRMAEVWMVFDVRLERVADLVATGRDLKNVLRQFKIPFDRLMLLTRSGLVDVT